MCARYHAEWERTRCEIIIIMNIRRGWWRRRKKKKESDERWRWQRLISEHGKMNEHKLKESSWMLYYCWHIPLLLSSWLCNSDIFLKRFKCYPEQKQCSRNSVELLHESRTSSPSFIRWNAFFPRRCCFCYCCCCCCSSYYSLTWSHFQ